MVSSPTFQVAIKVPCYCPLFLIIFFNINCDTNSSKVGVMLISSCKLWQFVYGPFPIMSHALHESTQPHSNGKSLIDDNGDDDPFASACWVWMILNELYFVEFRCHFSIYSVIISSLLLLNGFWFSFVWSSIFACPYLIYAFQVIFMANTVIF